MTAANKKAVIGQDGQSPKIGNGNVPLTPADLSKYKTDRDRHLSQVMNEQRQLQAASMALGRVSQRALNLRIALTSCQKKFITRLT